MSSMWILVGDAVHRSAGARVEAEGGSPHAHWPVLIVRGEDAWRHPEGLAARKRRGEGADRKPSFWDRPFGTYAGTYLLGQEEKVLEYIIHRIREEANVRGVMQEECVRRNASPEAVEQCLDNPCPVKTTRERMMKDFSSGKLSLQARQRKSGGTPSTACKLRLLERLRLGEGLEFVEIELSPEVSV